MVCRYPLRVVSRGWTFGQAEPDLDVCNRPEAVDDLRMATWQDIRQERLMPQNSVSTTWPVLATQGALASPASQTTGKNPR